MRHHVLTTVLTLALLSGGLLPAAAQASPPAACGADVPALAEGEQYTSRTLYLHTAGTIADVDVLTGQEPTMTSTRSFDGQSAFDLMADSLGAPKADSAAAYWRHDLQAPARVVCWQLTWFDLGGQPARASLWVDAADGSTTPTSAVDMPAVGARTTRKTTPTSLDATATDELVVQVGAQAGAVEFDSLNASSALTYVVIEEAPPEPDVLVIDIDFAPRTLTVDAGDTVTWAWQGNIPHDVRDNQCGTGGECRFDSGVRSATPNLGTRFSHTFTQPGNYPYYCSLHSTPGGTAHNGVIIVK